MPLLAIESSCDETAAAVLADETTVLSSVVASQLETHSKYGGVVPELASREHLRAIVPVVREALQRAGTRLGQLDAIAVTSGPGLAGSLLVGLTYAKALSLRPRHPADHREPHRRTYSRRNSGSAAGRHSRRVSRARTDCQRRPHTPVRSSRRRRLSTARQDSRRCRRRGLRQGCQTAWLRLSWRTRDRQPCAVSANRSSS